MLVPFTASYRPLWTGLGVVAMELLVALAITNRLRHRLPYRVWRRLHYASFAVWLAATAHGVMSGTDRDQAWLRTLYVLAVMAVVGSLALRLRRPSHPARDVEGRDEQLAVVNPSPAPRRGESCSTTLPVPTSRENPEGADPSR